VTLYSRMRLLAFQESTLRAFFGDDLTTFRWFYIQVPAGIIGVQTCARVLTVSQIVDNVHGVPMRKQLTQDRTQIDVLDKRPSVAAEAAAAIDAWLERADFARNSAFTSPAGNWPGTNIKLNDRGGLDYQTQRPTPVVSLEYRIWNDNT